MSSDSEDEGSEPWFFSGESPIKNWADEYDEDDEELDASDSSWLNDSSASQTPSSDSESRTSRGGKGPLPPARGAKKKKGQRGKAAEGAGKKAVAAQATSPQRGGGKANGGRKGANKNAKQGGKEGDRAGTATPAPAAGATTPKRGAGKKQKASSKKSVAVNRHLDSSFDSSSPSFETQSEVAYTSDPYTLASFATSAPEEAKIGHTLFPTVSDDFKSQMLVELLQAAEDPAQSFIVFARSTPTVVTLAEALDKINLGTVALKEDDPLELLPIYMDEFRAGKYRVLLIPEDCEAHTILSGLEHVTHSINYDVPDVERYLARMHALRAEEDMELIPLDVFTFITPHDVENVLALEMLLGPLRRHIGNVSSSLQPRDETSQHFHPTYQQHGDHARSPLHAEQKAQRAHNRQRREKKHSSPIKQQQSKPAKTKHIKQPTKTPKEVNKGFLPNTTRFSSSGASESWRSSPRAPVGGSWRA